MVDSPELVRNRKEMVSEMESTFGYIFCQRCESSRAFKFEVHHIIFRSERPLHEYLHNKINLIIVCSKCHEQFHRNKSIRNEIVSERGLDKIFGL